MHQLDVSSPLHTITLHCTLLELTLTEWERRTELGAEYAPELQKQVGGTGKGRRAGRRQ